MYIILCYDVGVKRVQRVRKNVKRYLSPIQESVFEGEITPNNLEHLKTELKELIEPDHDSILIYRLNDPRQITREQIGVKLPIPDGFI